MDIQTASDGFRATFLEAPGAVYGTLLHLLTDTQRRKLRDPLPASATLLSIAMFLGGAALVAGTWNLPDAWVFAKNQGVGWLGVFLVVVPAGVALERALWRSFGPSSLEVVVRRGRVEVHRAGRRLLEAPLQSCELRFDADLLGLIVDGRLHHWRTGCTRAELRTLTGRFESAKLAFGSPDDVPPELAGVVEQAVEPPRRAVGRGRSTE